MVIRNSELTFRVRQLEDKNDSLGVENKLLVSSVAASYSELVDYGLLAVIQRFIHTTTMQSIFVTYCVAVMLHISVAVSSQ